MKNLAPEKIEMTPLQVYHNAIASGSYDKDPAQLVAIENLEALYTRIKQQKPFFPKWLKKSAHEQGVYLYGEVGAGKTWMMDIFYDCLPVKKMRVHFHQFMKEVHQELKIIQGEKNPLQKIAKHLARKAQVICFDELFVNDITDAMLLGELFTHLFSAGIFLVITSNVPPYLLYRNGLQRARFYPAIELLQAKMQLIYIKSLKDYRWRDALSKGVYFSPLTKETAEALAILFSCLVGDENLSSELLIINHREVPYYKQAADVLWCQFTQLCGIPRSVQDYVELSRRFKIFILDEVPVISPDNDNAIWYLISLVDVLYDARCRLVIRSAAPPKELYLGEKMRFEYQRTLSRLQEMQTETYWQ